MGLLSKMFGGGTEVAVALDATQVPVGGLLSGRATVRGGKKDLHLTALQVRLLYVSVQSKDDSPMPDINTRMLLDNTVVSDVALPAGAEQTYDFQFAIPKGTEPSAHNVSYKVLVAADIPKVKDPTAEADLEVVEGEDGAHVAGADELYARWPALRGTAEQPLIQALRDLHNACYSERESLIVAEPLLTALMRQSTGEVREVALDAWANLLDGQVRKEHLRILGELVAEDLDRDMTRQVIEAAAKFADEGALEFVQKFAGHPDPEIRKCLADQLRFAAADKFPGKRALVLQLCQDAEAGVRSAAFGAMSDFRDDPQLMELVVRALDADPSPEVQEQCIGTLAFGHHHGDGDRTFEAYERHLQNPNESVRIKLAEYVHWLPDAQSQRIGALVQRLLADPSEDVRARMAWEFRNMEKLAALAPLLKHSIENDPSDKVRADGLGAWATVTPLDQAVPYYRARLQAEPTESVAWAVVEGLRWRTEDQNARAMLQELAQSQFARAAKAARDALED